MKYNEFVALKEQLKKEGSSLNEFTGTKLFEAEPEGGLDLGSQDTATTPEPEKKEDKSSDKLDTKGGGGLSRLKPAYAMRRKKLINNAKQFMKISKEQIIAKFLPKILKSQEHTAAVAVAAAQEGKNPKEIVEIMKTKAKESMEIQAAQLKELKAGIGKVGQNFETRVKTILSSEKLNDKEKLTLNTYWILLSQQVHQKLFASIVKQMNESTKKLVKDNPELEKILAAYSGAKDYNAQLEQIKGSIAKKKEEIKAAESEMKKGDEKEEPSFKVGETYQYTSKSGNTGEVEITEVKEDGTVLGKNKANPKGFPIRKDAVGKKLKDAPEAEPATTEEPATATA